MVVGGYHSSNCVKRVEKVALNMGINTIIDSDLTDLFFCLYRQEEYFNIKEYNSEKFKKVMMKFDSGYVEENEIKHKK